MVTDTERNKTKDESGRRRRDGEEIRGREIRKMRGGGGGRRKRQQQ